jgi:hypothetical protein
MATVPSVQEPTASASPPLRFTDQDVSGEKKSEGKAEEEKAPNPLPVRRGLPNEVKQFIVESFACFQPHSVVIAEVAKRYGIALDGRTLCTYDPRHRNCRIGPRLRSLYDEARRSYVEGTVEVAIAHQAHRLRLVSRIVEKATTSKDYAAALKGLELAAKEMGGALSGQTTVRHEGMIGHVHATVEEARAEISARLAQVVEGGLLLPAPPPVATLPEASPTEGDSAP